MAKVKYEELVVTNFKRPLEEAKLNIDTTVKTISDTYKKIIDDSDLSSIAETRDSWLTMIESINTKSTELIEKMQKKYDEMIEKAQKFDGWVGEANTLKANYSSSACRTVDDGKTNKTEFFVTDTGTDSEGYPTITFKKSVRTYSPVYKKDANEADTTEVDHYSLSTSSTDTSKTCSIKTDADHTNYITNVTSIDF